MRSLRQLRWDMGLGRELGFAFWAMFFVEGAFSAYHAIWPLYIENLGAPVTILGLLLGASGFLRLFIIPPSAAIADRIGSRKVLLIARSAALLGYIGASFAGHWAHLIPMIILIAIGEIAFPQIQAHVAGQAGENSVRAFAIVFVIGPSVALGLGPLLSGAFIGLFGLRAAIVFTAFLTACSIACFAALRNLEPPKHLRTETVDSDTQETPGTYRTAISDPNIRRILILHGVTIFSLSLGVSLIPLFLENVRGLQPAAIAQFGALQAIGSVSFGVAVSRFSWLQKNPFGGASYAVLSVATALAIFAMTANPSMLVLAFIFRGGLFSSWTLFSAAMGAAAKPRDRARGFALVELIGGSAFSLAPMIAGPLYAIAPRTPILTGMALAICLIPVLWIVQRQAHRAKVQEVVIATSGDSS